jgi:hypothetical protein
MVDSYESGGVEGLKPALSRGIRSELLTPIAGRGNSQRFET